MAGLPPSIISRASQLLKEMEGDTTNIHIESTPQTRHDSSQMSIFEIRDDSLRRALQDLDMNHITPIQAFDHLMKLSQEAKNS